MSTKKSPLSRIIERGHAKVDFKSKKSRLLMQFSEKDHRRIALLLKKWLREQEEGSADKGS